MTITLTCESEIANSVSHAFARWQARDEAARNRAARTGDLYAIRRGHASHMPANKRIPSRYEAREADLDRASWFGPRPHMRTLTMGLAFVDAAIVGGAHGKRDEVRELARTIVQCAERMS